MGKRCAVCKRERASHHKYCWECGERLESRCTYCGQFYLQTHECSRLDLKERALLKEADRLLSPRL